jgi:hypothetical protein
VVIDAGPRLPPGNCPGCPLEGYPHAADSLRAHHARDCASLRGGNNRPDNGPRGAVFAGVYKFWQPLRNNFLAASYSYLAALGAESVSLFDAALFAQCVPVNSSTTPDNELMVQALANATLAMLNGQYSATLVGRMAALNSQWGESAVAGGQWQGQLQ